MVLLRAPLSYILISFISVGVYPNITNGQLPVDTGHKLNVHKTFIRRPGRLLNVLCKLIFFFHLGFIFHEHSRFTGHQGKVEGIYLTPLYHFHPLHRHLDIIRAITAERSPLHIASSRTRARNLWYLEPGRKSLTTELRVCSI